MSLRAKLLALSLLTLILPWAGWQYAQEMEMTLRRGQEVALLTTADVLSRMVASEPELLYRVAEVKEHFDPQRGDLFAPLLPTQPLIDGFADEWPVPARAVPGFEEPSAAGGRLQVRLGIYGRNLHIYVEVHTNAVRYEVPSSESTPPSSSDRVVILASDEYGRERAWSLSAVAPGPIIARAADIGSPWAAMSEEIPHLSGIWRQSPQGYAIEVRGPLNLFGTQLSIMALDASNAVLAQTASLAWLHTGSEALRQRLQSFAPNGVRVSVVDGRGWLLARAGSIGVAGTSSYPGLREDEEGFTRSIYRVLFSRSDASPQPYGLPYVMWGEPVDSARAGRPRAIWFDKGGGEPSLVRASVPIRSGDEVLGALVVEQPGEELILVREQALTRLLNLTLVATLFSVVVTLLFAARLSHRIRRLSRAASTALTPEGRIDASIPDTSSHDELGALARSYETLLTRVKEYTNYLQTLGTKLSHELRTPLTIVSSSLDNLASEERLPAAAESYLERARSGTSRMHALLTALSEATRVEQSIEHTDRSTFDIAVLVRDIGAAYQQTFDRHRVVAHVTAESCLIDGSPDLIAQLLDKLMDNAADFTPPSGQIALSLDVEPRVCRLSVTNEGPALPPHLDGRLFESLVSGRSGSADAKPHLGLGLYIVRLIAEFHRGTVTAENSHDDSGVSVTVTLPKAVH